MSHATHRVTIPVGNEATLQLPFIVVAQALSEQLATLAGGKSAERRFHAIPKIGEYWHGQGGYYAGIIRGQEGKPDDYIVVHPDHAAEIAYGGRGVEVKAATDNLDGRVNTAALCESNAYHPAAEWAVAQERDGHTDFYLPARRELSLLCANAPELFERAWYWSSTQYAGYSLTAWCQDFGNGIQHDLSKVNEFRARAVRRFNFSN